MDGKIKPLILGSVSVLISVVTILAFYYQLGIKRNTELAIQENLKGNSYQTEVIRKELLKNFNEILAIAPENAQLAKVEQRFKALELKIETVQQQSIGLRQAINPSEPEEILTIARLTDEIIQINKNLSALEEDLKNQQKTFQDSVLREIKSSSESTTLILVVLLPLVLNFLYTVWKDLKAEKKGAQEP